MKRNEHNKSVGSVIERSDDRINATSEVFTPTDVCVRMIDEIPDDTAFVFALFTTVSPVPCITCVVASSCPLA